jgi:putative redox protein
MGTVSVRWITSKLMLGADSGGRTVVLSSWPDRDPPMVGIKPSDLLLLAAASCSMYDVVEILKKQREPFNNLDVTCMGEQLPDPPYTFTHIHLVYRVFGLVSEDKLEKAIFLSQEKYCSVLSTLRGSVNITHEYEIIADTEQRMLTTNN